MVDAQAPRPALIPDAAESTRLHLTRPVLDDWRPLFEYYSDPECATWTFYQPLSEAETERTMGAVLRHWERHGYGPYVLRSKADGAVVGLVGLWYPREWPEPEIKWAILRRHWGKGYASEAARAVKALLPIHLPQMQPISLIHSDNARSIALAVALGATFEKAMDFRNAVFHMYRHRREG